jgi:predicted DNA-binding transcriptional regulator AlpA
MESVRDIELLNAKQVQKILRCSLALIYKMAERGQLPHIRWECPGEGKKKPRTMVRFKLSEVLDFIERHSEST